MAIRYRVVPSAPGYRVGTDGSVQCRHSYYWPRRHRGGMHVRLSAEWHDVRPYLRPSGEGKYLHACVWILSRRRGEGVHLLVLEAFHGPRPPKHGPHWKNGDRLDNRPANLEWAPRPGRSRKLTEAQAREVLASPAVSSAAWARRLGVSASCIYSLRGKRSWRILHEKLEQSTAQTA